MTIGACNLCSCDSKATQHQHNIFGMSQVTCGSVVGCLSTWSIQPQVRSSSSAKHSFVGIVHEIISTDILSLPLIQIGQFSVTGERRCIKHCISV